MTTFNSKSLALRSAVLFSAISLGASSVQAQNYDFTINPSSSFTSVTGPYTASLDVSVKGDYDATTNPGGTRTRNGFPTAVTTGNESVPVGADLAGTLNYTSIPVGSLSVDIDTSALTFNMSCLNVDLFAPGSTLGTQTLLFQLFPFHTFAPVSTYFGIGPIPLTIDDTDIVKFSIVQSGDTQLDSMVQQGAPNNYRFSTRVPVSVTLEITVQGSPIPLGVIPIGPFETLLPMEGDFTINGATATIDIDIQNQSFDQTTLDPTGLLNVVDAPFAVPTLFPGGFVANLLADVSIASATFNLLVNSNWEADGVPGAVGFSTYCTPATNSSGFSGQLAISGSLDVTQKDILLTATNMAPNNIAFILMSQSSDIVNLPIPSQGLLCVGTSTPLIRLNQPGRVRWTGPTGSASLIVPFDTLPNFGGMPTVMTAGSVWNFQMWYRDQNPGSTSNTTNAARVHFCN